ncbi:MAG TPA: 4-hydroxy-tetrahydrodipicolinate synthase [Bacteroidetes bacterium]|nr:4-hydroxy-tetrahydrodipicolinate synthase [Bacteroidota bacterium]HRK05088.1 4-hydroxy-tetrahydrodipicolinate synthase [Chlorobiota bacterium]
MHTRFSGLHTAIITPMLADGSLDEPSFLRLVDEQVAAGVDGVVVCGSTGEGATLTADEKVRLWELAVERCNGRIDVIAGTGSNDTRATVDLSKRAAACGVKGLLVVTPYYNKPTPSGQLAHVAAVASAVDTAIILYNVPGRTGTNMSAETQLRIADAIPSVVATKEASANLEQQHEILRGAREGFDVLAGDDVLALPTISLGGRGVIAVVSNYAPRRFGRLIRFALAGDFASARTIQRELGPFFAANFLESNPGPVKYIMHRLFNTELVYRLPLVAPSAATQSQLDGVLAGFVDA